MANYARFQEEYGLSRAEFNERYYRDPDFAAIVEEHRALRKRYSPRWGVGSFALAVRYYSRFVYRGPGAVLPREITG